MVLKENQKSKFVNIIYCISRFQHGKVQILQYRARELSSGGREGGREEGTIHRKERQRTFKIF